MEIDLICENLRNRWMTFILQVSRLSWFPRIVPVKTKGMAKKSSGKKIVGCRCLSVDHFFADRFFCLTCPNGLVT